MLNTVVVIATMVSNLIFGMIEVSLLISKFGSSVNGLMQTGNQAFGYLSLIEAGLGAAFLYRMYKPVADSDMGKLSSLYTGFRLNIRKVVYKMLLLAGAISVIYPLFLKKEGLDYLYMVSVFVLLGIKSILPYRVTMVPKQMIVLKEKKYLAELISGVGRGITYAVEIALLLFADLPIQALLLCCIFVSLMTGFLFQYVMQRLYKNALDKNAQPDSSPKTMSKDILLHNISTLAFSSSNNMIISVMGSLNDVTIYSSYNMVTGQVAELSNKILDGASASLGIKIAHNDKNSYSVYREMLTGTYCVAGIVTAVFVVMINDFITLWIGSEFCVGLLDRFLFGIAMYCSVILPCIQMARNARGLYRESRNFTIAQALLNLAITLTLVPHLGITGALLGMVIARVVITIPFNYVLVDKKVFPQNRSKRIELIFGAIVTSVAVWINLIVLNDLHLAQQLDNGVLIFIVKACIATLTAGVIVFSYYFLTDRSFRSLIGRLLSFFINTFKKRKKEQS